jgi:2-keto-3-deoxy-L-rhamnonate aldolase RhmA
MKKIKERLKAGEVLMGCFLNLGSSLTAEIVGMAGFDWVLMDLEHGAGGEAELLHQMQALEHTPAAAIVRVESSARQRIHRVLDLGAEGVMIPHIDNEPEALTAVAGLRYPPEGVRGVAAMNRACSFGTSFQQYVITANSTIVGILQIETEESLKHLDAIAAVDGVDVLFVGPSDLSHAMGITGQVDHPRFHVALRSVAEAAARAGKAAGALVMRREQAREYVQMGYRFLCCSSDGGLLNTSARELAASLRSQKV